MSRTLKRVDEALALRGPGNPSPYGSDSPLAGLGARVLGEAQLVSYQMLRHKYRRPAVAFALACFVVAGIGGIVNRRLVSASTLVTVADNQIQNEWDLLRDESRDIDFEEQIRSRAVIEPVLRQAGILEASEAHSFISADPSGRKGIQAIAAAMKKFQDNLQVERLRHSGIVRITAKDTNAENAAHFANAVALSWLNLRRHQTYEQLRRTIDAQEAELGAIKQELETLNALRSEFGVNQTAVEELTRQAMTVSAQLSSLQSRYRETNPAVQRLKSEQQALDALLQERVVGARRALQERLDQQQLHFAAMQEPRLGTLDPLINHGEKRYQELLDLRAKARLVLTDLDASPKTQFGPLVILDAAVPPPVRSLPQRVFMALLGAAVLSLVGFVLVPFALGMWDRREEVAYLLLRGGETASGNGADQGNGHTHPDPEEARETAVS